MGKRYTQEFKLEAVRQVTVNGHAAAEVAERLGVSLNSLYLWIRKFGPGEGGQASQIASQEEENSRLKAELRRVTEERDILKKAAAYFAKESG